MTAKQNGFKDDRPTGTIQLARQRRKGMGTEGDKMHFKFEYKSIVVRDVLSGNIHNKRQISPL